MTSHPTYVAPSKRYRTARMHRQAQDAREAVEAMREWGYSQADVRAEIERIRGESYDPSLGEVAS